MKIVHIRDLQVKKIDYQRMMEFQLLELKQLESIIEKELSNKKSKKTN